MAKYCRLSIVTRTYVRGVYCNTTLYPRSIVEPFTAHGVQLVSFFFPVDDLWGSDENSLDNLEPTLVNHESPKTVVSDVVGTRREEQLMHPNESEDAMRSDSDNIMLSETGNDRVNSTTSQIRNSTDSSPGELGGSEDKTPTDACEGVTEKPLRQSDNEQDTLDSHTSSIEEECPKVLPEKLENQPVASQSSTLPEASSPSQEAAQGNLNSPRLEKMSLSDLATITGMDPPGNPATEKSVNSQSPVQHEPSPTSSGDSSWSKLSEEANGSSGKDLMFCL